MLTVLEKQAVIRNTKVIVNNLISKCFKWWKLIHIFYENPFEYVWHSHLILNPFWVIPAKYHQSHRSQCSLINLRKSLKKLLNLRNCLKLELKKCYRA